MLGDPFRIEPRLPVEAVKSYQAVSLSRPASCAEVGCGAYLNGWRTRVEGLPPDMLHAARTSGRKYTEVSVAEGETWLVFEAGQPCFAASRHRLPAEGGERWIVRGGDWRGNPRREFREHTRAEFWVEDFAEHQQTLAERLERG